MFVADTSVREPGRCQSQMESNEIYTWIKMRSDSEYARWHDRLGDPCLDGDGCIVGVVIVDDAFGVS